MKNTFAKLRAEKRQVQEKLNGANKIVCEQINQISKLSDLVEIQSNQIKCLNNSLQVELKRNKRLKLRYTYTKALNDSNYKRWMEDNKKIGNWKKLCSFITIASIVTILALAIN